MTRDRQPWPWYSSLLLALAIGCIASAPFAPVAVVLASGLLVIASVTAGRRLGGGRWPVLTLSVLATVVALVLLLTSLDLGSGTDCPDPGCGEHPVPEEARPSR